MCRSSGSVRTVGRWGFTPPHGIGAPGVFFRWPDPNPPTLFNWGDTLQPNIGYSSMVGAGMIVVVRDHAGEFSATLSQAVATAQTVAGVIKMLAVFG